MELITFHPSWSWALWAAIAVMFSVIAVKAGWLTQVGAATAVMLALAVLVGVGPWGLAPLLYFFCSSVALGKVLARGSNVSTDAKHGAPRDAAQVLCNGLPFALCACAPPSIAWTGMLASMAVATADTWSSEIGMAMRGRTWDVVRWKPVLVGKSGGVSVAGCVGGILGAGSLIMLVRWMFPWSSAYPVVIAIDPFVLLAIGVGGMLFDSVLGSLLQARYATKNGQVADQGSQLVGGLKWMTNDLVNLLSNAAMVGLGLALV